MAELNPYAPPAPLVSIDPGAPVAELAAANEMASKGKRLRLYADRLRVVSADGEVLDEVGRDDLPDALQLVDGLLARRFVSIRGKSRHTFILAPHTWAELLAWLGPPTRELLRGALKRNARWNLLFGILWVLAALPLDADPAADVAATPLDLLSLTMGLSLLVLTPLSWLVPHRLFFLTDAVWFAVLAGWNLLDIYQGGSLGWLIIVLLQISIVVSRARDFGRFAQR